MLSDDSTNVLVVDDAEQNRTLITTWLSSRPHTRVVSVDRAGASIACMKRERIDIVLLDMMMPGIDGYAAARLLRALPEAKNVPIIAITAKVGEEERNACIAAGCSDYLPKPLERSTLLALIDRLRRPANGEEVRIQSVPAGSVGLEALEAETHALVPAYLENRCAELTILESALASGTFETLQTLGHNLRGSGGSYGFPLLTEIGEKIERAAKASDATTLALELHRLREHLTDLLIASGGG